jgi:SAM-dependent methyltransferase
MVNEQRLKEFVDYYTKYITGDEKGEAHVFLDRLFVAFGYPDGIKGAAGVSEKRIKFTEHEKTSTRFADLVIEGRVLIEMKKRGEPLQPHYAQAMSYWQNLVPNPKYMVLCNFDEFWVYNMHYQASAPIRKLITTDLATGYQALSFLMPEPRDPLPARSFDLVNLTEEVAQKLSRLYHSLVKGHRPEGAIPQEHALRFVLQCMVAMFADHVGLMPEREYFQQVIRDALHSKDVQESRIRPSDMFTLMFTFMNIPGKKTVGRFYGMDYFNGGLFNQIYPIPISKTELELLEEVAAAEWDKIRPEIFGTLFEQSMDTNERHDFGAHYTYEDDIRRIVNPVIVYPWNAKINAAETPEALYRLHNELCQYKVLDPACGSGNFLYIAYRAMKTLERQILTKLHEKLGIVGAHRDAPVPAPPDLPNHPDFPITRSVSVKQFYGIDIKPFAVELAKVTLMIAKKLAVDELHTDERALPLDNLDANIRVGDALLMDWGEFDACIGNPPYLGAKRLKQERGVEYVNTVRERFPDVPGNADYCVYWFRKAHDLMKPGARAGLVGTNTVRQNYSRIGGLDYITEHGGEIYDAVSSQPWSGDAAVHVSIVNWSRGEAPVSTKLLRLFNGKDKRELSDETKWQLIETGEINSALSSKIDVSDALTLQCNTEPKRVFQGNTPGHDGFVLSLKEASEIVRRDVASKQVIFPYMTGRDLTSEPNAKPSRFIIDMSGYDALEISQFREAHKRIESLVLPERQAKAATEIERNKQTLQANPKANVNQHHQMFLNQWWKHSYSRIDFAQEVEKVRRYIICSRISKRSIFDFVSSTIKISDKIQAFVFEDDYTFGILQSHPHWLWWLTRGATLKSDPAYTANTIFDTFPFPQQPTPAQVKAVADAGRKLHEYRRETMRKSDRMTLREMYRSLENPGKNPLRELHEALDKAVYAAYGWSGTPDDNTILANLLRLNGEVAAKIKAGESVTAPGIPKDYPNPSELVSEGCIQPPELL